jgi:hypothetical protein
MDRVLEKLKQMEGSLDEKLLSKFFTRPNLSPEMLETFAAVLSRLRDKERFFILFYFFFFLLTGFTGERGWRFDAWNATIFLTKTVCRFVER